MPFQPLNTLQITCDSGNKLLIFERAFIIQTLSKSQRLDCIDFVHGVVLLVDFLVLVLASKTDEGEREEPAADKIIVWYV